MSVRGNELGSIHRGPVHWSDRDRLHMGAAILAPVCTAARCWARRVEGKVMLLLEFALCGHTVGMKFATQSSLRRYVARRKLTLYVVSEVD